MHCHTIRLDPDASNIDTIILPWGIYSYKRLPMGIARSLDIFQLKMSSLISILDYVRVHLDYLLVLSKDSLEHHLVVLKLVMAKLLQAGFRVNAPFE